MGEFTLTDHFPTLHHSIAAGDVVLANPPPYVAEPWLGAGIPLIATILQNSGLQPRVVRFLDDPFLTPPEIWETCLQTLWLERTVEQRVATMRDVAGRHEAYFNHLLRILLAGPETVFGFTTWRHNADLVLELARRLKLERPGCYIILGGPEASEAPDNLHSDAVDLIVGPGAEFLAPLAFKACLAGHPEELAGWVGTWVHPRFKPHRPLMPRRPEPPPLPVIDWTRILPLLSVGPDPTVPVVINVGCPFRCGFCNNTTIYPDMEWGSAHRAATEINTVLEQWKTLDERTAAVPTIGMCDPTVNSSPEQADEFFKLVRDAAWKDRPQLRGNFVIDGRMTPERSRLIADAGFESFFFGLESASPEIRREMKKPGRIEAVAYGLRNMSETRNGSKIACGVLVGWPSETEEQFHDTMQFMEWMATLGVVQCFSVMPCYRAAGAMDQDIFAGAEGMGLAWRHPGVPAGSPALRARRFLSVFEHFTQLAPLSSDVPRRFAVRHLLPQAPADLFDAWAVAHGDGRRDHRPPLLYPHPEELVDHSLNVVAPEPEKPRAEPAQTAREVPVEATPLPSLAPETTVEKPVLSAYAREVQQLLAPRLPVDSRIDGWQLRQISSGEADEGVAILDLWNDSTDSTIAIQLSPLDARRPAFRRTRLFNVSYLDDFAGRHCVVDLPLIERFRALVHELEGGPGALDALRTRLGAAAGGSDAESRPRASHDKSNPVEHRPRS